MYNSIHRDSEYLNRLKNFIHQKYNINGYYAC